MHFFYIYTFYDFIYGINEEMNIILFVSITKGVWEFEPLTLKKKAHAHYNRVILNIPCTVAT